MRKTLAAAGLQRGTLLCLTAHGTIGKWQTDVTECHNSNTNLFCLAILKLICLAQIMWLEPSSHKQISTSVSCDLKWTVCKPVNSFCLFLQLLSRILNYLLPFVTTIFVGHIGNAELAGYALASAVLCFLLLSLIICCTCSRTNFISCETLL